MHPILDWGKKLTADTDYAFTEGTDLSSEQAIQFAEELHDTIGHDCCTKAIVSRDEGLLLV